MSEKKAAAKKAPKVLRRDAGSGETVSAGHAEANPLTTTVETVPEYLHGVVQDVFALGAGGARVIIDISRKDADRLKVGKKARIRV